MRVIRRAGLAAASILLATVGAVTVSAPPALAANNVNCPATEPGFTLGASPWGASGVDSGPNTGETEVDLWHSVCHYRGAYWYFASGVGVTYPGTQCTWSRHYYFIGGAAASRINVRC